MKTTILITRRGEGYIATVADKTGIIKQGVRCGLTPLDAATWAARSMLKYATPDANPEGGEIMAPDEVIKRVPEHLRKIG